MSVSASSSSSTPAPPPVATVTATRSKKSAVDQKQHASPVSLRVPSAATELLTRAVLKKRNRSEEVEEEVKEDADMQSESQLNPSEPGSWAGRTARTIVKGAKKIVSSMKKAVAPAKMDDLVEPLANLSIPAGTSAEAAAALKLFFLGMVRGVTGSTVTQLVEESWKCNPELTLQILMQARDCRDGKGEKAVVLESLLWLRKNKPRTYIQNLIEFVRLGYFKDLLKIASMVKDRRMPRLGLSEQMPIEIELLAEFLRADQQALIAFQAKQANKAVTAASVEPAVVVAKTDEEMPESKDESSMEDVPDSAPVAPMPAADGFELMTAPSASAAASSSSGSKSKEIAQISKDCLKIDLCFVIDSTGSMGPWLEQVKTSVKEMVLQMSAECARSGIEKVKFRLALLAYQDYFDPNRYDKQDFTSDLAQFMKVVQKLTPRGGADEPEDLIGGLEQALKYSWDPQADTRMLLLIADAPAHGKLFGPNDSAESKKHLEKHPEDPEGVVKQIRDRGIHFAFTRITPSTDVMLETFQLWYDNRRTRKVMNVLQLGQRVQRLLPLVMEQLTLAALGRKPVIELDEEKEEAVIDEPAEMVELEDAQQPMDGEQRQAKKPRVRKAATCNLSLAGKWVPTEKSAFDRKPYHFASGLARLLFPESKQSAKLYRQLCSSLREQLQVVERSMCTQQWSGIDFATVPARCHKLLKKAFQKHEPERYAAFLGRVKKGVVSIKTAGLQPHELIESYRLQVRPEVDETSEAQWKTMVAKLKKELMNGAGEKKSNALAIIDTSGSMTWNMQLQSGYSGRLGAAANLDNKMSTTAPIDAALALGLMISELTTGAFKDRVLTFSEEPKWLKLPDSNSSTLCERVDAIYSQAESGGTTNLSRALDLILDVAVSTRCAASDLPSCVFVLSDMDLSNTPGCQFCLASMRARFTAAGYRLPELCLWNLSGRTASPPPPLGVKSPSSSLESQLVPGVSLSDSGLALLSGYSPSLLKLALKQELRLEPMTILMQAVATYTNVVIEEEEREDSGKEIGDS